jgi:PAS domain-containing protein
MVNPSPISPSSESSLAGAANSRSSAGLAVFDFANGVATMLYLNDAYFRIIHATRENRKIFQGDKTINAIHPDDRSSLLRWIQEATDNGTPLNCHYRILDGTGHYCWIGLKAEHEAIGNGVERFYGTYYDVNELVQDQERITEILDNVPAGLALMTLGRSDLTCQFANENFFLAHCWTSKFFEAHHGELISLIHPADRPHFLTQIQALREKTMNSDPLVYRSLGIDGTYHWVSTSVNLAFFEGSDPTYYLSSVNIDKRIAAELEAERIERMYESATDDMRLLVWDYDVPNHRAVLMEKGYAGTIARKYGIPNPVEHVPESLLPYVYEEDRPIFLQAYHDIEGTAEESHVEFRFQLPAQATLQYERISFKKIRGADGELIGILGTGLNITTIRIEREKYEKALAALQGPQYYASFRLDFDANLCWNGTLGKSTATNVSVKNLEASGTVDGYFEAFCKVIADEEVRVDFRNRFKRELILANFDKGMTSISIDYPFLYKNGERHWRRGTVALMRNPGSGHLEGVAYSTDIDAAKRSEFLLNNLGAHHFGYIGIIHPNDATFEFLRKDASVTFGEVGVKIPYEECRRYTEEILKNPVTNEPFKKSIAIDAIQA